MNTDKANASFQAIIFKNFILFVLFIKNFIKINVYTYLQEINVALFPVLL